MTTTMTLAELEQASERDLGTSPWHTIDQDRINLFADATDDHQWIHVDPERAAKGPFGATVAHGYLTMALLPLMLSEIMSLSDSQMGINYGTEKIRFTSPVPVNSRVRVHATLRGAERRGSNVVYRVGAEVEIEGKDKPALVGEFVFLAAGGRDA
jgi:acyl dehydratase